MKPKQYLIKFISFYQKYLSPDSGFLKKFGVIRNPVCVFYPTCSEYTKQAVDKYGVFKGIFLGMKRILPCQKNHIDPLK